MIYVTCNRIERYTTPRPVPRARGATPISASIGSLHNALGHPNPAIPDQHPLHGHGPFTTTTTTTTTASPSQSGSPILQPRALAPQGLSPFHNHHQHHHHGSHHRLSNSFSQQNGFLLPESAASPDMTSSSPAPSASAFTAGATGLPEQKIIPGLVHERARKGSNYSMSSAAAARADLHAASPARGGRQEAATDEDGNDYGVV